jgi:elongation factor P hydroxylase
MSPNLLSSNDVSAHYLGESSDLVGRFKYEYLEDIHLINVRQIGSQYYAFVWTSPVKQGFTYNVIRKTANGSIEPDRLRHITAYYTRVVNEYQKNMSLIEDQLIETGNYCKEFYKLNRG